MSEQSAAQKPFFRALGWLVTLLTPVALVLTAVRALMSPAFLRFEYNTPAFPPDSYGFSKEERLYWSGIALGYLLNDQGIEFLGDLRFEDGSPVYNERELRHMVDVKIALSNATTVWLVSLVLLVLLGVWARLGGWWAAYCEGLGRGGLVSALLILLVIVIVLLSFGVFFVAFHNVFFEPGTWMFLWSDTLIRLFPERFWRDIFIYIGVMTAGLGLLAAYLCGALPPGGRSKR